MSAMPRGCSACTNTGCYEPASGPRGASFRPKGSQLPAQGEPASGPRGASFRPKGSQLTAQGEPASGPRGASFRPKGEIATLRSYLRQRERLLEGAAAHIQHMQKALTEMNLQLHQLLELWPVGIPAGEPVGEDALAPCGRELVALNGQVLGVGR